MTFKSKILLVLLSPVLLLFTLCVTITIVIPRINVSEKIKKAVNGDLDEIRELESDYLTGYNYRRSGFMLNKNPVKYAYWKKKRIQIEKSKQK